ncbi:MAG: gliding motility associated protein GldN, partial [Granulosicoccus sp.]
ENLLTPNDSVWTYDLKTEQDILVPSDERIEPDQIFRYRIKEQWIFDKQHSRMTARTIGIAPLIEIRGEDGSFRGFQELFWIDYPESRKVLAQHPVFLRHNDNKALNYDDLFAKRYYDSFLVKESNVFNRNIREYAQGIDGLLEGERIEEKIRNMESDFWAY